MLHKLSISYYAALQLYANCIIVLHIKLIVLNSANWWWRKTLVNQSFQTVGGENFGKFKL